MKKNRSEKGQALVLIMLAIVAIFGFAGLALDGGRAFSERRRAQNAADAAAFAAASAAADGDDFSIAGLDLATSNGYNNNGLTNWVTVSNPPISGAYGPESGRPLEERSLYYQVTISQTISPIFSQIFWGSNGRLTVEAVSRVDDYSPFSGTNALMALQTATGQEGIEFDGNITVEIHGGNVWSNNNGIKNGNSGNTYVYSSLDNSVLGNYFFVGSWRSDKRDKMFGNFVDTNQAMGVPNIPQPYCPSGSAPRTETWNGVTYYKRNGGSLPATLSPGVWCITGELNSNTVGNNVLVVLLDNGIKYTGNGDLQLTRDSDLIDRNGNQYGGMVIYAPLSNTNSFRFGGNSQSVFNGTVFAPGMDCDLGGTPNGMYNNTALICNTIKIHGNPVVRIRYRPEQNYQLPHAINLAQ